MRKLRLGPEAVHHVEPFFRAGIAVVVLVKRDAVLPRFLRPPRRHDVQRQPPAADIVNVRCLLRQQRRGMIGRPDRDHQL